MKKIDDLLEKIYSGIKKFDDFKKVIKEILKDVEEEVIREELKNVIALQAFTMSKSDDNEVVKKKEKDKYNVFYTEERYREVEGKENEFEAGFLYGMLNEKMSKIDKYKERQNDYSKYLINRINTRRVTKEWNIERVVKKMSYINHVFDLNKMILSADMFLNNRPLIKIGNKTNEITKDITYIYLNVTRGDDGKYYMILNNDSDFRVAIDDAIFFDDITFADITEDVLNFYYKAK